MKTLIGWLCFVAMLGFCLLAAWDYGTTRIRDHERRIAALEREARPLIVVDRFSHVYLNGESVYDGALEGPEVRGQRSEVRGENAGND